MITPLDIQNKEFKKSFRGYKESEVDQFLDEIIEDYEKLYKENIELKDKILILDEKIKQYNNLEETLKDTLVVAQSTADEVTRTAREKSEIIIEDAELMAKKIITAANEEVKNIQKEYGNLKKEIFIFKTRFKSFIEAQLISLDEFYSKIEMDDTNIRDENELEEYIDGADESNSESQNMGKVDNGVDDLGA
ncbi:Cell-division initiation protein DivIVA (modular protein) [[Clostridium] ultunense Esp]|uniref:Cell-division initiation protein DivIVA (Modular protein) n=1 Tax=[Clostridium] ultunense Esp TaxID=1288971 RepID=M1YZL1_9FIRM|nr:DivIVA domain-containing protein [Schnuerera ultunensis]CCQ96040.1 Cell-division initiation protein DivIVA (modular protein) [[Clostridium] ultunense Esp]SHD76935.1 Cell-division initiation protein DivIVA (Modular protein) [[Clostridium] ultunense Esp]